MSLGVLSASLGCIWILQQAEGGLWEIYPELDVPESHVVFGLVCFLNS
jgi:hypothetical protein